MNVLISACLLGVCCKYSGGSNAHALLMEAARQGKIHFIPVCPECLGGLSIPRVPSEKQGERVFSKNGEDLTEAFERGARAALHLARLFDCRHAILKERSPSCGFGQIYDGTFTGNLRPGDGVTAALLARNGVQIRGESQARQALAEWDALGLTGEEQADHS